MLEQLIKENSYFEAKSGNVSLWKISELLVIILAFLPNSIHFPFQNYNLERFPICQWNITISTLNIQGSINHQLLGN